MTQTSHPIDQSQTSSQNHRVVQRTVFSNCLRRHDDQTLRDESQSYCFKPLVVFHSVFGTNIYFPVCLFCAVCPESVLSGVFLFLS